MQRSERLLKASVAACLSTGVAVAMHVAGGGEMPSVAGLTLPLLLAFAVSAQLAGATSRWRLAIVVVFSQFAFHSLFTWGVGSSVALAPGQGAHAGHDPHGMVLNVATRGHASHMALTPAMFAAHALAAVGTYAVLRRADVFLESGKRWLSSLLSRLDAPPRWRPAPLGIGAQCQCPARPRSRIASQPHGLRGPPLLFA